MTHTSFTWKHIPLLIATIGTTAAQIEPPAPSSALSNHGDPYTPVGTIQVTPMVVREGVRPDMTWGIEYPLSIADLFIIGPTGSLMTTNPKSDKLGIRVVGSSLQSDGEDLPVALWVRVGGSGTPWELVFYGASADIEPSETLYSKTIHEGTKVDFTARGRSPAGSWYSHQWTLSSSSNVAALTDGEPIPAESSALSSGESESFMTQFLTEDKTVDIGPREILYLFELDSADPGSPEFDMQDLAIVVSSAKNNNGHGNNADGVDVSNPGQGHGGPNGRVDESGEYDDEGRIDVEGKIKRKKK